MRTIGIRELKEHASQIVRRVRENKEEFQVTYHGRVVARLIPVTPSEPTPEVLGSVWTELDQLAAEIGAHWPEGVTATEAVSEERREL